MHRKPLRWAAVLCLALAPAQWATPAAHAQAVPPGASPAPAQAPATPAPWKSLYLATPAAVIAPPVAPAPGGPLVLFADASTTVAPLAWRLKSPAEPFEVWGTPLAPAGMFVIRRPTPGATYRVGVAAFGDGPGAFDFTFVEVVIPGGDGPPIPPDPGPGPAPGPPIPPGPTPTPAPTPPAPPLPTPAPLRKPFAVTLIFDDATITPAQASLYASPTVADAVAQLGGRYYGVKAGSAAFKARGLDVATKGVGVPAMLVQEVPVTPGQPSAARVIEGAPGDEAKLIARLRSLIATGN